MGFGLFDANCAFNFKRRQDLLSHGWKTSRLGCREERESVFALAVLFGLTGRDANAVRGHLQAPLFRGLRAAVKSLRRRPALPAGIAGGIG